MPSEDTTILEFNQCHESDKILFISYANFECLIEKVDGRKSNSDNKNNWALGFSVPTISSFKYIENKHEL